MGEESLNNLIRNHPRDWERVRDQIIPIIKSKDPERIRNLAAESQSQHDIWSRRVARSRNNPKVLQEAQKQLLESEIKNQVLKHYCDQILRNQIEGKKPLRLWNRFLANRLLFFDNLERKPVSNFLFRLLWPLIGQKGRLLSLLNSSGIYCFYSDLLLKKIAHKVEGKTCLEIAAGDGMLTKLLQIRGVSIQATDDYSWKGRITFPNFVEELGASDSLQKYKPQVVICSWPPAGNDFEATVFNTPSVEFYIVLGSQHRFAAGNWEAYEQQDQFELMESKELTESLLPPETNPSVLLFKRRS